MRYTPVYAPVGAMEKVVSKPSIDLIRIWAGIQEDLKAKHGVYRYADDKAVVYQGLAYPKLTYAQLKSLFDAWSQIGYQLEQGLKNRPELQLTANKARLRYIFDFNDWYMRWSAQPAELRQWEGKYVRFNSVKEVFQIISRYVIALNGVAWAIVNIESEYQRWMASLPPGMKQLFQAGWFMAESVVPQIKEALDAGASAIKHSVGLLGFVIKNAGYILVLGSAAYLYWSFKKR